MPNPRANPTPGVRRQRRVPRSAWLAIVAVVAVVVIVLGSSMVGQDDAATVPTTTKPDALATDMDPGTSPAPNGRPAALPASTGAPDETLPDLTALGRSARRTVQAYLEGMRAPLTIMANDPEGEWSETNMPPIPGPVASRMCDLLSVEGREVASVLAPLYDGEEQRLDGCPAGVIVMASRGQAEFADSARIRRVNVNASIGVVELGRGAASVRVLLMRDGDRWRLSSPIAVPNR